MGRTHNTARPEKLEDETQNHRGESENENENGEQRMKRTHENHATNCVDCVARNLHIVDNPAVWTVDEVVKGLRMESRA